MRESLLYFIIFIMILCLFPSLIWAKTGYVSDRLVLSFRQGPNKVSAIIKTLKSDTPVLILEEKNEFYKIELKSNEIGWVEKKFITSDLPKTIIIDRLKQENASLKIKNSKLNLLEGNLKKIKTASLSAKDIEYKDLIENDKNIKKLIQENKLYKKKNLSLSKKLESLEKKNTNLFKTGMIKWFLSGVGVLLLGWVLGQSVTSRKRKSNSLLH